MGSPKTTFRASLSASERCNSFCERWTRKSARPCRARRLHPGEIFFLGGDRSARLTCRSADRDGNKSIVRVELQCGPFADRVIARVHGEPRHGTWNIMQA